MYQLSSLETSCEPNFYVGALARSPKKTMFAVCLSVSQCSQYSQCSQCSQCSLLSVFTVFTVVSVQRDTFYHGHIVEALYSTFIIIFV